MPSRKRRAVNGALIGAAATALTVKSALAGPLGSVAQRSLGDLGNEADNAVTAALSAGAKLRPELSALSAGAPRSSAEAPVSDAAATQSISEAASPQQRGRTRFKNILRSAAKRHGIDPRLVLALAYWESGWDQSRVSSTGAVGLMQVEPESAEEAGPALLGRVVDVRNPYDNADVGAAILREDLDHFSDPAMALAAYYQGPSSLQENGMLPDTQAYVQGILSLMSRMTD